MEMKITEQDTAKALELRKEFDGSVISETIGLEESNQFLITSVDGGDSEEKRTDRDTAKVSELPKECDGRFICETIGIGESNHSLITSADGGHSEEKKPQRNEALDPIIEEKQERIDDLLDHFTRFVNKRNFKNYQYVIDLQDQLIKSYQDQLKALIDMPDLSSEESTSVNSPRPKKRRMEVNELERSNEVVPTKVNNASKKKKLPCFEFMEKGFCTKEYQCPFSHERSTITFNKRFRTGLKRRNICFSFYKLGTCTKQNCEYIHVRTFEEAPHRHNFESTPEKVVAAKDVGSIPDEEIASKSEEACFYLMQKGVCREGQQCSFSHDPTAISEYKQKWFHFK